MSDREILNKKLLELSKLYKVHWKTAVEFEGAKETAIFAEFSSENDDAGICVSIMKEMSLIKNALKTNLIGD